MTRGRRLALIVGASLNFLVLSAAFAARPAPPLPARNHVWAQSYSDLPAEGDIRFGTLPNGMRYAIMRNTTPGGQASLRLRIGSGSLEETDDQQGLAHVLEHMAFKGAANTPGGDVIKILERLGLAFGPDTNAFTAWTETVYMLDLPETDATTVDTGLGLMRDIAGDLALDPAALQSERGVVLSEERLRDTPAYEVSKAELGFLLQGQLAPERFPIGLVDVVKTAPASRLRAYYEANYRPDRATLIAAGDFDPAEMEAKIKARFSDWRPVGPAVADPDLGQPLKRGEQTQLIVEAGATPTIRISWVNPYDDAPDTFAKRRRDTVEAIALAVLNRRLEALARGADPPFIGAGAGRQNIYRSARVTTLAASFQPDGWRRAIDAAVETQRQALQYGVRQDEVDREITELRETLRTAAAGASTRRTPTLANEIVNSVDDDQVFTSPQEDLDIFEAVVKGLTAAEADQALRTAFRGSGPLVSLVLPAPPDGGDAALAAEFAKAERRAVPPPPRQQAKSWRHTGFGAPGRVVERREIADLGTTFVRFANGVRLTVKPTSFHKDEILVSVNFGRGRLDLPKARPSAIWASSAFVQGGLDDLTYEELERVLAGKVVGVRLGVGEDAFSLSGSTRPEDFDTQLQLLAAYMTAPGWRPEGFKRDQAATEVVLNQLDTTPEGVEARDLGQLEHSLDARWHVPSIAEVRASRLQALQAMLAKPMAAGPIEVEIIGDTTFDKAIQSAGSTFGALPRRREGPVARSELQVRFPGADAKPVLRRHRGRSDQAIAYIAWPATDFLSNMQRARAINIAAEVLKLRLIDQVRIAEGATYSPAASTSLSEVFPGYGFIHASVEIPPAKISGFLSETAAIAADMGSKGITADELERARKPRIEGIEKQQQTNEYWLAMLHGGQTDPRRLDLIRTTISGYRRLTTADVQRAAATYLAPNRAWRFMVEPVNPAPTAPANSAAIPVPPTTPTTPALPTQPGQAPPSPPPSKLTPAAPAPAPVTPKPTTPQARPAAPRGGG